MPINRQQVAKASGFQNNCGLNALTHKLMSCLARNQLHNPDHTVFTVLRQRFNAYYDSNLTPEEFRTALSHINNDYHREVILAPVLRTMILMDEVVAPMRETLGEDSFRVHYSDRSILNPGTQLEDFHLISLANFFGLRVESYTRQNLVQSMEGRLDELCDNFNLELTADHRKRIRTGIQSLTEPNPNFANLVNIIVEPLGVPENFLGLVRSRVDNEIRSVYQNMFRQNLIEQIGEIDQAQNRILVRKYPDAKEAADIPTLKLWNQGGGHWEYEEESLVAKNAHNQFYDGSHPDFYQYGYPNGAQDLLGAPDAQNVRRKIIQALNPAAGGAKNLQLTNLLQQYAREQRQAGFFANANPNAGHQNARQANGIGANNFNFNNNAPAANPFAAFGNILKGGMFSDVGNKILAALIAPFKEDSNPDNNPAPQDSGKPKSLLETLMQGIITAHSIIMKLASAFVGLKPVIDEIQTGFNRQQNPEADLQTSELGQHPDANIFAEYVKLLPGNTKARLNSLWLDPALSKASVMNQLGDALMEAGLQDELEFFNFKRRANQLLKENPALQRHLIKRWDEQVYARSQVQPDSDAGRVRENHKQDLLNQLSSVQQRQEKDIKEELDLVTRAKAIAAAAQANEKNSRPAAAAAAAVAPAAGRSIHNRQPGADAGRQPPRPLEDEDPKILREMQQIQANAVNAGIPFRHPNARKMNPAGIPAARVANPAFTPAFNAACHSPPGQMPEGILRPRGILRNPAARVADGLDALGEPSRGASVSANARPRRSVSFAAD